MQFKNMSDSERELLLYATNCRLKNTRRIDLTPFMFEYNQKKNVWTVKHGAQKVMLKIWTMIGAPFSNAPTESTLSVNFEESQTINPLIELWHPNIQKILYARYIHRVIKTCFDESKLVFSQESCIQFQIDVVSMVEEGSILDLAVNGVIHALKHLEIKNPEGEIITNWFKPCAVLSIYECNGGLYTEPKLAEAACCQTYVTFAVNRESCFCGIQKFKSGTLSNEIYFEMIDIISKNVNAIYNRNGV